MDVILGVDPGLNVTGYGVLRAEGPRITVLEGGVIHPTKGRATTDMAGRLKALYDGLSEVIAQYRPTAMSVEQLFSHYDHPRTAVLMAHARGAILLAAAMADVPTFSYGASQVKKAITGQGRATKVQMQNAMLRELGLGTLPEPHDVADALAIALCHRMIGRTHAALNAAGG